MKEIFIERTNPKRLRPHDAQFGSPQRWLATFLSGLGKLEYKYIMKKTCYKERGMFIEATHGS